MALQPLVITLNGVKNISKKNDPIHHNQYDLTFDAPAAEMPKLNAGPAANPRVGCPEDEEARDSRMVPVLKEQLRSEPDRFHLKNGGVTTIADRAEGDCRGGINGVVTITYSDPEFLKEYYADKNNKQQIRGITNGLTTVGTVTEAINEGIYPNDKGSAYVRVTVRCGSETNSREDVLDVSVGLNASAPQTSASRGNYEGDFDEIKTILDSETAVIDGQHFPPVEYYQGSVGDYKVDFLVQLLVLYARRMETGGEEAPCPWVAYAGEGGCMKYFSSATGKAECMKYLPLLPSIVHLYEYMLSHVKEDYNLKGSLHQLKLFEDADIAPRMLPYTHLETTVRANNAWTFPLLGAFLGATTVKAGKAKWVTDPEPLFSKLAFSLISDLNEAFKEVPRLTVLGRVKPVYKQLRTAVENAVLKQSK